MNEEKEQIFMDAATAAKLIKDTAEHTAISLNIQYIQRDIVDIKESIKGICDRDDQFVLKEEFAFWRNLLVGGLLLSIVLGVIINFFGV